MAQIVQHFVLWTIGNNAAFLHHNNAINHIQHRGFVGDKDQRLTWLELAKLLLNVHF
ncbi:Uncharacterised protein [Vibrio cholerae]|nr:Uncharacterised protein [Vibrio cholerae]CSC33111.1 Uncharacterised protein [Vibrio cholerae]CSC90888.1 Uncharacterised protein [Vibrio cholerae]